MDEKIIRSLQGDATEEEEQELQSWRRASVANEIRYRRVARLWELAGEARPSVRPGPAPPAEQIIRRAGADGEEGGDDPSGYDMPFRPSTRRGAGRWIAAGAAAAAFVLFGLGLGELLSTDEARPPFGAAAVVTGPMEKATVRLADGSVARLAPESRLQVTGEDGDREVWVDGRAYFSVAERHGDPFWVRTRAGSARVLGTRFAVSLRADTLRLAVVEGSVALSSGDGEVEVEAGQASTATGGATPSVSEPVEARPDLRWMGRFLAFQSTPLSTVARSLERRYEIEVRVLDDLLARRTVTAWFTDQTVEQVLSTVCRITAAHCTLNNGVATIEP